MSKKHKHPDDVVGEASAIVDAAERWTDWRDNNAAAVFALILTYSDADAEVLGVLRERFWSL